MTETQHQYSLREFDRTLRKYSEKWLNASLLFKASIFVIGAISIFLSVVSIGAPIAVLVLTGISEWCRLKADEFREKWESLHRALDFRDSFGWQVSKAAVVDLLVECPREIRNKLAGVEEVYFASVQPPGSKRAVENVEESAWWAKHIARRAGNVYLIITLWLISLSIIAVLVILVTVKNYQIFPSIGRIATAIIMLVFSLNLINLSLDYFRYHRQARSIVERAQELLRSEHIDTEEAIRLWNEYHLSHAAAPINPSWIYKQMKDYLNELWKSYRRIENLPQQAEPTIIPTTHNQSKVDEK